MYSKRMERDILIPARDFRDRSVIVRRRHLFLLGLCIIDIDQAAREMTFSSLLLLVLFQRYDIGWPAQTMACAAKRFAGGMMPYAPKSADLNRKYRKLLRYIHRITVRLRLERHWLEFKGGGRWIMRYPPGVTFSNILGKSAILERVFNHAGNDVL